MAEDIFVLTIIIIYFKSAYNGEKSLDIFAIIK